MRDDREGIRRKISRRGWSYAFTYIGNSPFAWLRRADGSHLACGVGEDEAGALESAYLDATRKVDRGAPSPLDVFDGAAA